MGLKWLGKETTRSFYNYPILACKNQRVII